ncbi:hypothetical protein FM107_19035 [Sphingobacterium sp. JB170]|nr:hypothetical protein FM107_19035 [Sphingobacterium sp. JB170]
MNRGVFKRDYVMNVQQDSAGLWEFHHLNEFIRCDYQLAKSLLNL